MIADSPSPDAMPAAPRQAVQRIYAEHHAWLYGWLRRKLGDAHDAADLAQDTFERLLRSRDTAPILEPRAYLTTIAQRLVIGRARRTALEQAYAEALALMPAQHAPSPEQHLQVLQTLEALLEMLDGLPLKCRNVFILAQVQGMSYTDIGAQLGMTRNAVQKSLARALAHCYVVLYG